MECSLFRAGGPRSGVDWISAGRDEAALWLADIVRPLLKLLSCPLIVVTLGLFYLVINGVTLWLASSIAVNVFPVGFHVDGFGAAFWGALIVSIVSVLLNALVREETK